MSYDAIIIGSGAGGAASAYQLSRLGLKILLLESGPVYDPVKDYLLHTNGWELTTFPDKNVRKPWYNFGKMQILDKRHETLRSWNHIHGLQNQTMRRLAVRYSHIQGLGGSTLHFTGEAHRLNPASMKLKTDFAVGADWPVSYEELEKYYVQAERIVGVAGAANDKVRTRSQPYPLPPHPLSYASQKIAAACKKLGLNWVQNSLAVLSQAYDGRPECNYCNQCNRGCPRRDKGSVDVTFLAKVDPQRCTIKTGCHVLYLTPGKNDRIDGVHYVDETGKSIYAQATWYIVACGAIATPRLLLNSKNAYAPDGLANESGQVGRNFLESVSWTSCAIAKEPVGTQRGLPADGICWDFNGPQSIPGLVGGCRFSLAASEANLTGPINYANRVVSGWGIQHKQLLRQTFGRVVAIGGIAEQLPNPASFVALDNVQVDEFGMPKATIYSHLAEMDIDRLKFMAGKTRDILQAMDVETVFEEYGVYDRFNAAHVFGTCRMGESAQDSVVDRYCCSHRWRNLSIVDGSVFPSSGGGEAPSLTIEALALYACENIHRRIVQKEA
ncbi:MAG TPA: GMC family oxidoreductase [Gammaproteobacteria bacterium]